MRTLTLSTLTHDDVVRDVVAHVDIVRIDVVRDVAANIDAEHAYTR